MKRINGGCTGSHGRGSDGNGRESIYMRMLMACAAFPQYGRGDGPVDSNLIARALATQPARVRVPVVGDAEAQEQRGDIEVIATAPLNVYRDWLERDKPC
jgi:hypothetical protein